jgi:hypothetical protein
MHCPSAVTQNERKYVPIQTISPVALASSDVQKKLELNSGIVVLTSSPYVQKMKEIAARKKGRMKERTGVEKVWNMNVQKVTVMLRRHCSKEAIQGQSRQPFFVV